MAEFVTVINAFNRMRLKCEENCFDCPLGEFGDDKGVVCDALLYCFPKEAEKILMDWAAAHPVETMKDRFFKMFPNAPKTKNGYPRGCLNNLGWTNGCPSKNVIINCTECWNRPYEERNASK